MSKLTEEELKQIDELVEDQKSLGFTSFAKEYYNGTLELNEKNYIKVNLPDTIASFKSGNGEGIWACPVTIEDKVICNSNVKDTEFNVYALNDCIYYPIACASIIRVKCTGKNTRPILSYDWMDSIIKLSSNGEQSILDIIS